MSNLDEDEVSAFAWCGRFTIHGEHDDCMGWGAGRTSANGPSSALHSDPGSAPQCKGDDR